jgi:hypothetical protein
MPIDDVGKPCSKARCDLRASWLALSHVCSQLHEEYASLQRSETVICLLLDYDETARYTPTFYPLAGYAAPGTLVLLLDRMTFWLGFDILPIMRAVARVPNVAIRFENYTGGRAGVDQLSSLEYSQKNRDDLQQLLGTTELMYAKGLLRVNVRLETSTLEFKFKYRVADLKIERHRENHSAKCVHCHARKTYLGKPNLGVLGKR